MKSQFLAACILGVTTLAMANPDSPARPAGTQRQDWSLPVVRTIEVQSPAYGEDVQGDVPIRFTAKGFAEVTVRCWMPGEGPGADVVVGRVTLDESGAGSVVFPADRFPHGPLSIRLSGSNETHRDNYYLMVYNTGGPVIDAGIPDDDPSPAKGMKLVFADDFDTPELSISRDGKGATYASHKPGGGDFSGLPFGDHENRDRSPFSQRDTYLRIRADQKKNVAGLISSVSMEGQGVTAKAPCYFECRFIAQNASGTWPAFWIITNRIGEKVRFSDELDVMEGYGGEGAKNPNANGKYHVTTHYWSQGPGGKGRDTKQAGAGEKRIQMYDLHDGRGSSWYESFHTYGVYVGLDETVYYCDGIPVHRHPTARVSKQYPFQFMINLAVGGASRWPIDLSRYGGIADMYVDYVRVYQGE